ncbi:hypothetical protein D3C71_1463740 [compost metagenome]
MIFQQALERLQHATLRRLQCLWQQLRRLGFPALAKQQDDPLAQGTDAQQHSATGHAALDQPRQALLRLLGVLLAAFEQGLLQFDMQRQQGVEFRCCRRLLATVGLAQAQQPGFGKVDTALGQPQLALHQGNHGQVEDRRHIPDMHEALRLGQLGEGFGEMPFAAIERGDHAVPDQYADITTGPRLAQPGTQARTPLGGLQA